MLFGAIADDFTGASDLANTLAGEGMATTQFVGIPKGKTTCEAGVVSLKTRTIPVEQAIKQSLAALDWLLEQGCQQILFKYCSTFDSTNEGNIGQVAEALLNRLGETTTLFCPAFPANKRSIYMGHLFVGEGLLNESGMQNHPLTPMTDANLVRVLQAQTKAVVSLIPFSTVAKGVAAIETALSKHGLYIIDALDEQNLRDIGKAAKGLKLITGGSGIALGVPSNFGIKAKPPQFTPTKGAGLVISGSCSVQSQQQVKEYAKKHPALLIEADALMSGRMSVAHAVSHLTERLHLNPMIYSTLNPEEVKQAQETHGKDVIAAKFEDFFGEIAAEMVNKGVTRLVVGGGETSGAVVQSLEVESFAIGTQIAAGVPALTTQEGLKMALKSGNFGQDDFYERALAHLGTSS